MKIHMHHRTWKKKKTPRRTLGTAGGKPSWNEVTFDTNGNISWPWTHTRIEHHNQRPYPPPRGKEKEAGEGDKLCFYPTTFLLSFLKPFTPPFPLFLAHLPWIHILCQAVCVCVWEGDYLINLWRGTHRGPWSHSIQGQQTSLTEAVGEDFTRIE